MVSAVGRSWAIVAIGILTFVTGCRQEAAAPTAEKTPNPDPTPAAVVVEETTPFELETGFQLLKLENFDAFGAEPTTWKESGEILSCTGRPRGYLYSKEPHQNFTWRLDLRFVRPATLKEDAKFKGNTGLLVYINGEHKLWPVCIEIQGKNVQMGAIRENGGAEPVVVEDDDAARGKARKSVGQWNSIEIVSKDGALSATLNGTPIATSKPGPLTSGWIGIQAEDHPFEIRRMRIRQD